MRTVFLRRRNIGSLAIRLVTWSSWSHCGVIFPDDTVIEARAFHGVTRRPLADLLTDASEYAFRSIDTDSDPLALAFAESQIGKPYDYLGVAGLALHREWDEPDAWWCSEFLEACVKAGGRERFVNQPRRITPQLSWMVA